MKENKMKIEDESGDKKYFTIIPNFILNHSTAIDQALYLQMKRIAGDNRTCQAGYRYFLKQLGIGEKAYKKSLKYLLKHEWITFMGKKPVETQGGIQKVNVYKVNNLWKKNVDFYEGGAEGSHPENKGGLKRSRKVVSKEGQGGSERRQKKNHEEEPIRRTSPSKDGGTSKNKKNEKQSLKEFIKSCKSSPQKHIQIIGEWAEAEEPDYATKAQWQRFIKRNLRAAKDLTPFSTEELQKAYDRMLEDVVRIDDNGKKVGFLGKYTLETLSKYI